MRSLKLLAKLPRPNADRLIGRLRQVRMWDAAGPEHVRFDIAYRDPASGRYRQYGCDVMVAEEHELPEHVLETVRAVIARELHRQCGIERAIENQHLLSLPQTVQASYV